MKNSDTLKFSLPYDKKVEDYFSQNKMNLDSYILVSKTLDARGASRGKKPIFHYEYTLKPANTDPEVNELKLICHNRLDQVTVQRKKQNFKPVIIGLGPAGLFAAYTLMKYGVKCKVVERGKSVQQRMKDIAAFWRKGELDPNSNVCFGHGGAGLFSDGKLITRVKSEYIKDVMQVLVNYGADPSIKFESNPHLGSNKIRKIIDNMVSDMKSFGHEFHNSFNMQRMEVQNQQVKSISSGDEKIEGSHFLLAAGHSADNVYTELIRNNIQLSQKDFAIGVRIEHPRKIMQELQYGQYAQDSRLPTVRYRLSYHNHEQDRGGFSFCMCPGGYVLSSGTDRDGLVTNGMSNSKHNSPWSNSAIVASIKSGVDFSSDDLMAGLNFQRKLEKIFYNYSCEHASGREIPACYLSEFMQGKLNQKDLPKNSCPSGVVKAPIYDMLPAQVTHHLRESFSKFDRQIKGFIHPQAILYAPETRTSSPFMIDRDRKTLNSVNTSNLFPSGEGAGYAGGITSAAVDGIKCTLGMIDFYLSDGSK